MEENQIRNKIITISGQPVTGKGTNVKAIIRKLIEQGYKEENIHLQCTGDDFREYFNDIIHLIQKIDEKESLENLAQSEKLQAVFSNEQYRKVLIEAIKTLKRNHIDFSDFSIEKANNLPELNEIRQIIDEIIDEGMKQKGKEINEEKKDDEVWIIDSRLAFFNIPESFSVRLTANDDVAASRLFNDNTRGEEDREYETLEEAKEARIKRKVGETIRYKERYGVELENTDNYDLVIDTSYASIEDISETILRCMNEYYQNRPFAKTWTSPKTLLPLQNERNTISKSLYGFEEIVESIKKYNYFPSEEIEVVEVDNCPYIIEGHHRNFASAYIGKTLVPYKTIAKDDEKINEYANTARQRASALNLAMLKGHEYIIANSDPDFTYESIYPGIYKKIKEKEEQR